jgi:hypothetical protein
VVKLDEERRVVCWLGRGGVAVRAVVHLELQRLGNGDYTGELLVGRSCWEVP